MKTKLTVVMIVLAVFSNTNALAGSSEKMVEYCQANSEFAKQVMNARQKGLKKERVMGTVGDDDFLKMIVDDAYEYTKYPSEHSFILEQAFESKWLKGCLKIMVEEE